MTKRLIDRNPLTGEAVWWEYQASDDSATITHTQDVDILLDRNVASANDDDKTKTGIRNDWWKYASIPNIVAIKWLQEKGVDILNRDHKAAMFKLLNDPEYRWLKTTAKHHE